MTRKDYVAIAKALGGAHFNVQPSKFQWINCVEAVANVMFLDNPKFDRSRFINAALDAAEGK
jgi:hypothetical protein